MPVVVLCVARDAVRALRLLDELLTAEFVENQISLLLSADTVPESGAGELASDEPRPRNLTEILTCLARGKLAGATGLGALVSVGSLFTQVFSKQSLGEPHEAAFQEMGISVDVARILLERLKERKILVAISCRDLDQSNRAEQILLHAGAEDLVKV